MLIEESRVQAQAKTYKKIIKVKTRLTNENTHTHVQAYVYAHCTQYNRLVSNFIMIFIG